MADYRLAVVSRTVSQLARQDVLNGKAKFGIFGDGKEVAQVALAHFFKHGDWRSGYYRDQTLMMALGLTSVRQLFAQLYADTDINNEPSSAGRQMVCHFATPTHDAQGEPLAQLHNFNSAADLSPVAAQMPRALGLAYASKLYRSLDSDDPRFSAQGNEVAVATIGDASTSEGIFWETLNAAGVLQVPLLTIVWDDSFGISVPTEFQTCRHSISQALAGFQGSPAGVRIQRVRGWNYEEVYSALADIMPTLRADHQPALLHVCELTQPQGHSTSGSHERYKSQERLRFETEMDGLTHFRSWILEQNIASTTELAELENQALAHVQDERRSAWQNITARFAKQRQQVADLYTDLRKQPDCDTHLLTTELERLPQYNLYSELSASLQRLINTGVKVQRLQDFYHQHNRTLHTTYGSHLYNETSSSALLVPEIKPVYSQTSEVIEGRLVILKCMENLFATDQRFFAIGEDIGALGGVNLCFQGLQEQFGALRVTDTGIREATILGQGIGAALRGLRPIVDIQYLDYLLYCLQILSDDLASLHYRTAGQQLAPVIIRTKGHRLEGIWHSGSMLGMVINAIRGVHVCVPRNMVQALGMYNTLAQGSDPAIVIEVLNGYRRKEKLPDNYRQFTVPLGKVEVLRQGNDLTLLTYGACVRVAVEACQRLAQLGIDVELIDAQCLLPFDRDGEVVKSLQKTNAIAFLDEDAQGGATGFMMQQVLEKQRGYEWLDAQPITITAADHRPPYGTDGNYYSKPNAEMVCDRIKAMF
ncbi:MAG: thiamine pyrophosphate-dependent enzyme [Pseudomonadota bacterium]|nr:thiamine pyrophosphate-dependent enzyme [Pseudomonadota bacterium]